MSSMQKHSSCVFHDSPHDMKTFQSELEPCRSQTYLPALRIIFKKVKKPSSPAYQLLSKLLLVSKDFSLKNKCDLKLTLIPNLLYQTPCLISHDDIHMHK